ncbi:Rab11 family-interacting protein 3 [Armadillidium nasatum]|uniref:Rab11 family-interacting protein 3 n=1 Tax=Armadillidium nasatum TaxID=96803 RepID=A0A5N5SYZ3_9CRUS|nr:Rab11 family-interacting protein 3 [Armadillidium nasatum]
MPLRVMMLEEQLRETEMRAEDRLSDEQKRNKEMIGRVEREKQLTVENYSIKYCNVEKEKNSIVDDNLRLKKEMEKLEKEKLILQDKITEAEISMSSLKEENVKMGEMSRREKEELRIERERGSQPATLSEVIEELRCEVERLRAVEESYRKRSPSLDSISGNTAELEAELKQLKDENKQQVEDLQAQLLTSRLEEGRTLVSAAHNSLAAEFEQMTNDEEAQNSGELEKHFSDISVHFYVVVVNKSLDTFIPLTHYLRKSLKDCQEANQHLRAYIDGILLNIVENYPQLLEVKRK